MSAPYTVVLERDSDGTVVRARVGSPLIDTYLGYLATIGRAPTTWSSYAYDLSLFCRWLAARHPGCDLEDGLRSLAPADVFLFVEHEFTPSEGRHARAAGTVYRRIVALGKFFDWAVLADIVPRNPVPREGARAGYGRHTTGRPALLRVPMPLPRPAPTDELTAFSATLRTWRDRALVALLVGSGLRLSEALGLRIPDLDWGGRQVFVRHGKGGRQRYAMVPDPAWVALKTYFEGERPDPVVTADLNEESVFVVLHGPHRGRALTAAGVQSLFRHHRTQAGSPNVTPHRLRHTCGTELHRAGMSLEFLQEQLGHRRLDSTRLYVHLSNERLRAAYLAVADQLYRDPTIETVP